MMNYDYSYATAIGCALKKPLFFLATNIIIGAGTGNEWETGKEKTKRIAKLIFHSVLAGLFAIPAAISWAIGKSFLWLSRTKIDSDGLHLAPPSIQIPASIPNIDIMELVAHFISLDLDRGTPQDKTLPSECLKTMCSAIKTKPYGYFDDTPLKREMFFNQMLPLLQGITVKLRSVEKNQQETILLELAEASSRCYPTWIEVATKIYGRLNNCEETVPVKLLQFVQEYKENVILQFAQINANAQWHALNLVRNMVGDELGLNKRTELDVYAGHDDPVFSKNVVRRIFLELYEDTNRLITAVQTMINSQPYNRAYHDYVLEIVKDQNIPKPEDYVSEHFFNPENGHILFPGVNLMLRNIGVLK